jgi:hypothetical protein
MTYTALAAVAKRSAMPRCKVSAENPELERKNANSLR